MTTIPTKKICVKCVRGAGIVTCDGCHQSFCHKHLSEHRKELLEQVDHINNQCQHFKQNLAQENDAQPLLLAIDNWEQDSIEKIHTIAATARNDVRQMAERTNNHFSQIVDKLTTKMNSSRETDDVTEIDLTKWNDELQTLKNLLKKPFPIGLSTDDKPSSVIRFIKVNYDSPFIESNQNKSKLKQLTIKQETTRPTPNTQTTNINVQEKFSRVAGHATITDNDLIATFVGYSSVCGIKRYGTGVHRIRFEIIDKRNEGIFFGIVTASKELTPRASELPSVYGWRDFDRVITNGNAQLKVLKDKNIEPGDQLTLTIDCDHPKLILTHHQLNQKVQMSVDINKCPFPWKLIVSSFGEDVIAIHH